MDKSIIITADMIALESMNPSQLMNAIPTRLPKFLDDVKGFVHGKVATLQAFWGNKLSESNAGAVLKRSNYYALSHIEIFVPTGLTHDYLGYVDALSDAQRIANVLLSETLQPTSAWLGELLGRPDSLKSVRESHTGRGLVFHDIKKVKARLTSFLDGASNQDKIDFGKVFKNGAEFENTVRVLNDLNKQISLIDRKAIQDEVDIIVDMMDRLMVRMRQDPKTYAVSGVTMQSMAKVALNLAEEVEFFAAYFNLLQNATATMDMTIDKLKKIVD